MSVGWIHTVADVAVLSLRPPAFLYFCAYQPNFQQPTPLSKGYAQAARTNPLCPLTHRAGNACPPQHLMTNGYGGYSLAKIILRCVLYHFLDLPCRRKLQLPIVVASLLMGPAGCRPFSEPLLHALPVPLHLPHQFCTLISLGRANL